MLKSIGYWSEKYDEYAAPAFLVDNSLDELTRKKISHYLEQGQELFAWLGFSHCRFRCGVEKTKMGCRDLTDGEWVWPEGFSHYIRSHNLGVPREFMDHLKQKNFDNSINDSLRVEIDTLKQSVNGCSGLRHDPTIWNSWLKAMGEEKHFLGESIGKEIQVVPDHMDISLDDLFGK